METTIRLSLNVKKKLDSLKIYPRESYNDILLRLVGKNHGVDVESLTETIEVMGDSETMRDIAEAMRDYEEGRGIELRDLGKELNLNV